MSRLSLRLVFLEPFPHRMNNIFHEGIQTQQHAKLKLVQKAYIFIDTQDPQLTKTEEHSKEKNSEQDRRNRKVSEFEGVNSKINRDELHYKMLIECLDNLDKAKQGLNDTRATIKKVNKNLKETHRVSDAGHFDIDLFLRRFRRWLRQILNTGTITLSIRTRRSFKKMLVKEYDSKRADGKARCMLIDQLFPSKWVVAAHLLPRSKQHIAKMFLGIHDIYSVRNGLLLFKPIEWAYDRNYISFIVNEHNQYLLKVVDPNCYNVRIIDCFPSEKEKDEFIREFSKQAEESDHPVCDHFTKYDLQTTFGDLDGQSLAFSQNTKTRPYKRCLNLQAILARHRAFELGYIKSAGHDDDIFRHFLSKMFHQITK